MHVGLRERSGAIRISLLVIIKASIIIEHDYFEGESIWKDL